MIVARTMMMQGNLQAMDRLIKLTSELDRYHGFAPAQIPWAREAAPKPRLAAPEPRAISPNRGVSLAGIAPRESLTAKRSRSEMAPQQLEKIESAPGNGMVSETLNPQDVVHGRADRARLRLASRARMTRRNFLSRNPLKSLKAAKESRSRRRGSSRPVLTRRGRGWGSSDPWTRLWRSPEAERAPPPSLESGEARSAVKSKGNFPPRKVLKSLETAKEARRTPAPFCPPRSYGEGLGVGLFAPVDEALEVSGSGGPHPLPLPASAGRGDPW
jgi:hypothetical protein